MMGFLGSVHTSTLSAIFPQSLRRPKLLMLTPLPLRPLEISAFNGTSLAWHFLRIDRMRPINTLINNPTISQIISNCIP
jgi:hypothetical protein